MTCKKGLNRVVLHKTEKSEAGHDNIFKYIDCYRKELVHS